MAKITNDAAYVHSCRYQVLSLLCLCAVIAYVQRAAISVPAREIAGDLKFTDLAREMGMIQSAWYFCYAVMQLPSGWLADRIGSRRGIAFFSVVWSLATLLCGFATDFVSLLILWSLMGAAQAGAFPCAVKAIGQVFPETERARGSGLLGSGMLIGGALAPILTAVLLEALNPLETSLAIDRWKLLLACYAIPGILWAVVFVTMISVRKLPSQHSKRVAPRPIDWSRMLSSLPLALLCAQQFFRAAGMIFFMTWFPTFLQETRGVSLLRSGMLTTIAGSGAVLGSLTGGFFSDWLLKRTGNARLSRQGIAFVGMTSCSLLIIVSYFIDNVNGSIALITLGAFCASFGGVSGYVVAISFGGRNVATVFSTMNMFGNFGASLFPITAGWLVATTGNWNFILFLFSAIMAIDAICWALLNPRGTLFGDENEGH